MLTKTGIARDYKDLFFQYMSFLTEWSLRGERVVRDNHWILIDPRLDSFYGATLVIPAGWYGEDEDYKKIWINNNDDILLCKGFLSFYDDRTCPQQNYFDLVHMLKECYPNSDIEYVGDRTDVVIEETYRKLQETPVEDLPNIIISTGIIKSLIYNGKVWDDYINIQLNNLFTFCKNNNIKLYCCVVPSYDEIEYYDDIYYKVERFISNTGERLINLPIMYVDMFGSLAQLKSQYNNYIHSISFQSSLIRILLQDFMSKSRLEYFVSFEYRRITVNSYSDFLNNYKKYQSEEFNTVDVTAFREGGQEPFVRRTYSKNNAKNPFKYTGEFCAVGLHTTYDSKLWMCEQGGITCKREADKQINDINLLPFWQFDMLYPLKRLDIPVYPGTGCPWMTIADIDKSKYIVDSENPINYYFTKTDSSSTITVRVCHKTNLLPDCWQSISFGCFTGTKDTQYPLYVGGGNLALFPDWWMYYNRYGVRNHVDGLMYNLSMKNPALCNSNILHTTKFGKANLSNFRVMATDGSWRDIYSAYQTYKEVAYYQLPSPYPQIKIYEWGYPVLEHTYDYSFNTGAQLVDTRGKTSLLTSFGNYNANDYLERVNLDYITVELNASINDNINMTRCVVENTYASWSRGLKQGLHSSNDRLWLVVPNGWEDRLWYYDYYYGNIYWGGKSDKPLGPTEDGFAIMDYVRDEYNDLLYGNKMIKDRLVIDFGYAPVDVPEFIVDYPENYIEEKDSRLILKAKITITTTVEENEEEQLEEEEIIDFNVIFNLYVMKGIVEVDFGDGNVELFSVTNQIAHNYSSPGTYYINIRSSSSSASNKCLEYRCSDINQGLVYSIPSNDEFLEELYFGTDTRNFIYFTDNITSSPTDLEDKSVFYIMSQHKLKNLYFTYLAQEKYIIREPYTTALNNMIPLSPISVIDCTSLEKIYIINDGKDDYPLYKQNKLLLNLNVYCEQEIRLYIDNGFSSVYINTSLVLGSDYDKEIREMPYKVHDSDIVEVSYPLIHVYLYSNQLVVLNDYTMCEPTEEHCRFCLHVPTELYNLYRTTYKNVANIVHIYKM